jgi:hypothetical protein
VLKGEQTYCGRGVVSTKQEPLSSHAFGRDRTYSSAIALKDVPGSTARDYLIRFKAEMGDVIRL